MPISTTTTVMGSCRSSSSLVDVGIVVTAGWGWSGLPYLGRKRAKRAKDGRLRAKRAGRKGGRTL
jgi:hypothetical protein